MTAIEALAWLDYGPAGFDARQLPRGCKRPDPEQPALFFAPVPPRPAKSPAMAEQLPGQAKAVKGKTKKDAGKAKHKGKKAKNAAKH